MFFFSNMSQLNKSLLIYCNLQMMREKKEPLIRTRRRKSRLHNSPYLCMRWTILTKNLLEGTINRLTAKKIISLRSLPPSPGAAIIQFRKELLAGLNIHLKSHYLNHPWNCVQKWQVPNFFFLRLWNEKNHRRHGWHALNVLPGLVFLLYKILS